MMAQVHAFLAAWLRMEEQQRTCKLGRDCSHSMIGCPSWPDGPAFIQVAAALSSASVEVDKARMQARRPGAPDLRRPARRALIAGDYSVACSLAHAYTRVEPRTVRRRQCGGWRSVPRCIVASMQTLCYDRNVRSWGGSHVPSRLTPAL